MSDYVIDVSQLPFPELIETLDYETTLVEMKDHLQTLFPFQDLETEPLVYLTELFAYFNVKIRARINDAAKGSFVAFATGANLEHRAALFGIQREIISPADPDANPPTLDVMESDDDLRARVLLAPEALSTAGPRGSYRAHAINASPEVFDVSVIGASDEVLTPGPLPGEVWVYILGRTHPYPAGATPELIETVAEALNAEDVRPLCDRVTVMPAVVSTYAVTATLFFQPGPDRTVVMESARKAVMDYVTSRFRLGLDVIPSAITAALYQPGVAEVVLTSPAARIAVGPNQARRIVSSGPVLTDGGVSV